MPVVKRKRYPKLWKKSIEWNKKLLNKSLTWGQNLKKTRKLSPLEIEIIELAAQGHIPAHISEIINESGRFKKEIFARRKQFIEQNKLKRKPTGILDKQYVSQICNAISRKIPELRHVLQKHKTVLRGRILHDILVDNLTKHEIIIKMSDKFGLDKPSVLAHVEYLTNAKILPTLEKGVKKRIWTEQKYYSGLTGKLLKGLTEKVYTAPAKGQINAKEYRGLTNAQSLRGLSEKEIAKKLNVDLKDVQKQIARLEEAFPGQIRKHLKPVKAKKIAKKKQLPINEIVAIKPLLKWNKIFQKQLDANFNRLKNTFTSDEKKIYAVSKALSVELGLSIANGLEGNRKLIENELEEIELRVHIKTKFNNEKSTNAKHITDEERSKLKYNLDDFIYNLPMYNLDILNARRKAALMLLKIIPQAN